MRKLENWVATYAGTIGLIIFVLGYTTLVFFLGMVHEWDTYGRVKEVEIQTKILEYRLGDLTLGRDTINVIKEKPVTKKVIDTAWFERPLNYDYRKDKY